MSQYDAIVIGSGATGGVAALTLAESGAKVLVIESGKKKTIKESIGAEPINTINRISGIISGEKRIQSQHPGYWKNNPLLYSNEFENKYITPKDKPFLWTQGDQVGGRSLTWGGITLRLSEMDLKPYSTDGYGSNWPINYKDLEPHYCALEKRLNIYGDLNQLEQLPDGIYKKFLPFTASENYLGDLVERNLGYPFIHSRGFGPYRSISNNKWPSFSSLGSTLGIALSTGKVEIMDGHIVERIVFEANVEKANGIVAIDKDNGSRKEINANLIVLCASTIQTIKILLNSEISKNKDGFIDPSGKLGCNLMDHISTCHFFTLPKDKSTAYSDIPNQEKILSGAGSFFIPFGNKLNKIKKVDFIRGYGIWGGIDRFEPPEILKKYPDSKIGFLIGHGEVLSSISNNIILSSKQDRLGLPIPLISFQWGENERKMVINMNQTINQIIDMVGGQRLPINQIIKMPLGNFIRDKAVALKDQAPPPGYYIHEVGGAQMGSKENESVVDKFNRLWRCKNVLVVDGACWPTSSWQSPTLTMMAITRRACLEALKNQA